MPQNLDLNLEQYLVENINLPKSSKANKISNTSKNKYLNVTNGALPLIIENISRRYQGPILIISTDPQHTDKLEREIKCYNPTINFLPFPDWETLPYDSFSPHSHIISERIETLYRLNQLNQDPKAITSISLTTALHRLCPVDFIKQHAFFIKLGDRLDFNKFKINLISYGYTNTTEVNSHGEFSIKGSVIDIYPMGIDLPLRIDLFDDEIDSIRTFDPETQKSIKKINEVNLLPAHEFSLSEESIKTFRANWRKIFPGNHLNSKIYQDISKAIIPSGIEYYIPLFFEDFEMDSIFDYLESNTLIIVINHTAHQIDTNINNFYQSVHDRHANYNIDQNRPLLDVDKLFTKSNEFFESLNKFNTIEIDLDHNLDHNLPAQKLEKTSQRSWHKKLDLNAIPIKELSIDNHLKDPLSKLKDYIAKNQSSKFLFTAESAARKDLILDLFKKYELKNIVNLADSGQNIWQNFLSSSNNLFITIAKLDNGFTTSNLKQNITVVSESELYGEQVQQRRLRKHKNIDVNNIIKNLTDLLPGQYVVHELHGIGKYLGLETITVNNITSEYLNLLYADNAKIYIPVTTLDKISRYSSIEQENIVLNKLGNKNWGIAKQKALEKIRDTAAELLAIYAKRAANTGFAYKLNQADYNKFCADFKFEETPDQQLAITQVLADMQKPLAMDRLISGDVGFGKTEVALRASFIAVNNNKQVAILVPTTLLAQQHYENFCDRFASFAINIELLSRFKSSADLKSSINKISSGKADIVIGTHKILQESVKFKDLGLLIIDEEHRFGVTQKEKIKKLRSNVDILTLTATPIPRTLNLALSGMRDLSIITTPPQKRLAIKTFVHDRNPELIFEAISRELKRGGQVFYLHNNIKTINNLFTEVSDLFPDTKIAIAHGQMRERELEKIMSDFYHRKYHILICTTIIETGIDIPSANTILMDRADKLGLAQLHQLRGRVGRSHHQAYAYLFTPKDSKISSDAQKRLDAIAKLEDLGAGFLLASNDMEIRGTGNLLGDEQSGHIEAIGYGLYMDMLNKAVTALKSGEIIDLSQLEQSSCEVDLKVSSILPEIYIPDVNQRLVLYKRIATVVTLDQLQLLKLELVDRFGKPPEPVNNLFIITEIKLKANIIGIIKIDIGSTSGKIKFNKKPKINHQAIISLIQKQGQNYKLSGEDVLSFYFPMDNVEQKYNTISKIFESIAQ